MVVCETSHLVTGMGAIGVEALKMSDVVDTVHRRHDHLCMLVLHHHAELEDPMVSYFVSPVDF